MNVMSTYILESWKVKVTLLAMIALLVVQSCAVTFIHNVIMFIDTSNNDWHNQAHWLIRTPYLSIIASNAIIFVLNMCAE